MHYIVWPQTSIHIVDDPKCTTHPLYTNEIGIHTYTPIARSIYLLYVHSMLCLGVNHKSLLHNDHAVFIIIVDYQPALSLESYRPDFSKRLSTFTYSFQESCSLYPRCTSYFSVEHSVSPLSVVSTSSSGCTVEYTISNLERCRTYHSTATVLLDNQRGNTIMVGDSVMLSE